MVKIVSRFTGMFLVSRLSLQSTPNWLSGFLKDSNTNCTQFLFMILTIRSFEVTHSGHHSFLRNLPPLLWSESVSKGKNVCRFWLEVCGKDELKESNWNEAFICVRKLFSTFSYFMISELWRAAPSLTYFWSSKWPQAEEQFRATGFFPSRLQNYA